MNSTKENLNLVIIAGPNRSGKTTVADFLLHVGSLSKFLNADTIAKGLNQGTKSMGNIEAGKIMLNRLNNAIKNKEAISFETTLSGLTWKRTIEAAKRAGYEITICYVIVNSASIAISRIKERVSDGGHPIPDSDVERRYHRSLKLFLNEYSELVDNWYFFDNSEISAELIALREAPNNLKIFNKGLYDFYLKAAV